MDPLKQELHLKVNTKLSKAYDNFGQVNTHVERTKGSLHKCLRHSVIQLWWSPLRQVTQISEV